MAKLNPPPAAVLPDDDAILLYGLLLSKTDADVKGRKSLTTIAKKHGITIEITPAKCRACEDTPDHIRIFDNHKDNNKSKTIIRHLRNAFAHLNITLDNGRCKLFDIRLFRVGADKKIVKQKPVVSAITMLGNVDYEAFKAMLEEFFENK